jgi:hypothetical protein
MSKLYIFGIGGTGARVLKSLVMLLAAGVECKFESIVPIIIDPDDAAADLTRTVETMKKYMAVREKLDFTSSDKNQFFKTEILQDVQNFRLPLNNTRDVKFRDYMAVEQMNDSNKALINMLFSEKNLESNMKVGFKGNPNIGSVVLNQFADSLEFQEFANNFQQGDSIFIISSIFGGTGASGFPLLLKTLKNNDKIPNFRLIQEAPIGAISVLPYFKVKQDESSSVDSATFISKTKSALSYYERTISESRSVSVLYYISDTENQKPYENHEGGAEQKNDAHFIELVSALAILDFARNEGSETTVHKEFGIETNSEQLIFKDLGNQSRNLLRKPLTQFMLFTKYLDEECMNEYKYQPWALDHKINEDFFKSDFYADLRRVQQDFTDWLEEMDNNDRKFSPFELSDERPIFDRIKGEAPKSSFFKSYALFDHRLNKQKTSNSAKNEQKFVELFFGATEGLVNKKFNF